MTSSDEQDYRIWKYELRITDEQELEMPMFSEILSVADQHGSLCLWAAGDTKLPKVKRTIEIIGTGNPIKDPGWRKFIGTVSMGSFVWHVFERMPVLRGSFISFDPK